MTQHRKSEGFNLAFLDIMSCGLGAVILVFMLVKHQVNYAAVESDHLSNDVARLASIRQESEQMLQDIGSQIAGESAENEAIKEKIIAMQAMLADKNADASKTAQQIEKLKDAIKTIKVNKTQDIIETKPLNEENYLLGLRVEGKKIAILLDSSASMTDEKLIDIIKTKNSSTSDKQQAVKWQRSKRIVKWLLARMPKESKFLVVMFNDKARALSQSSWMSAADSSALSSVLTELDKLIPEGGTNLQAGLQKVNTYAPSDLYVITDGLPTKGESRYKSLNPFAGCSSLRGSGNTISGVCRVKLFQQTITESSRPNIRVNVVLLPVEGDPDAVNQYWHWSGTTGGLVISPAGNWP